MIVGILILAGALAVFLWLMCDGDEDDLSENLYDD